MPEATSGALNDPQVANGRRECGRVQRRSGSSTACPERGRGVNTVGFDEDDVSRAANAGPARLMEHDANASNGGAVWSDPVLDRHCVDRVPLINLHIADGSAGNNISQLDDGGARIDLRRDVRNRIRGFNGQQTRLGVESRRYLLERSACSV